MKKPQRHKILHFLSIIVPPQLRHTRLVAGEGFEPSCLSASDFESDAYTSSAIPPCVVEAAGSRAPRRKCSILPIGLNTYLSTRPHGLSVSAREQEDDDDEQDDLNDVFHGGAPFWAILPEMLDTATSLCNGGRAKEV